MPITDDRTSHLNMPLPVSTNALKDDVVRIRESFTTLDSNVVEIRAYFERVCAEIGLTLAAGSFEEGATITSASQAILYFAEKAIYIWGGGLNKTVLANSTPATSGGVGAGAWVDRTQETVRVKLASSVGAAMIGDGLATQADLNSCDVRKFGAETLPFDSTSAFTSAYADSENVYVPEGDWLTTAFYPDRTFGPGRVFSTYAADGLYQDPGERPILKAVRRDSEFVEHTRTFGNFERAAGKSLVVNDDSDRAQVSGYSSDSEMATYINADHVGYYIGMHGPKNQIVTANATTTYTSTSITAPEITQANVDAGKIKVGMFVKTKHVPRYSGRVLAINVGANELIMSGWWAEGNTASGQVPANGTGAVINAADKIWGQNTNLYIESASSVRTATGYELGILADTQPADPVWGMHIVNLTGTAYEFNRAYYVSGKWTNALYATGDVSYGLHHIKPAAGVFVENTDNPTYGGYCLLFNNSYPDSPSQLLGILNGGTQVWGINGNGHRSSQRESVVVVGANATITPITNSIILCNNSSTITLTLSGSFKPGHVFEVKAVGTGDVNFGVVTVAAGGYGRFIYDGSSWIRLI